MTTMTPRVIDISHHNVGPHNGPIDFAAVAASGIWGVIHKATQGRAYADPDYPRRRVAATEAGLLWGAYHFNTGDKVQAQVDWFIAKAQPDEHTLMVLDFEDNRLSQMSIQQAVEFLHLLEQKLGRKGAIYSGNRLKESVRDLSLDDRDYIAAHRLWLCQYGAIAKLPAYFEHWWLWQYTGDGVGLPPHNVPGVVAGNGGVDLNVFAGTQDDLAANWA